MMKTAMLRFTRFSYLAVAGIVYGCGGGGDSSPAGYVGETLVIDGRTYSEVARPGTVVPGEITVVPKDGMREEVRRLVEGFGLSLAREERTYFLVRVPVGFEQQWADVLRRHGTVASASPTPLRPTS